MSEIEFKLVPEKRATVEKIKRGSKFDPIIDQFNESKETSVRIDAKGIKAMNLAIGLRNRIKQKGIRNITVSQRGNKVYLLKR